MITGEWNIIAELNEVIEGQAGVPYVKAQIIKWFGNVEWMTEDQMPIRILRKVLYHIRKVSHPRLRWIYNVTTGLNALKIKG